MRRLEYGGEFFFLRSSLGAVSKGATPVKYTDICHFEQTGINAEKFQNTRIRFNSDAFANLTVITFKANLEQIGIKAEKFQNTRIRLNSDVFANLTVVTFNALYIPNERVTSILSLLKLLWSKEENYDDSLEELFILQNIVGLKVIRCKVFISDFGFKISGDLTKPGFIIIISFWIQASMFVNVALSYEKRLTCLSQWTQKGHKKFYNLLSYVISHTVKTLRLTNFTFGHIGGGRREAGAFGEMCVTLKYPGYAPD